MKVRNVKSHRATKITTHSIGKRNVCLLAALYHLNKNQRTIFLRNADGKLIRCICEICVVNTLKGNVSLERSEKNRLTKYKKALRRVIAKRCNWKDKRKLLVQRDGFLPYIIEPILSILLSLIIEGTK